MTKKQLIRKTLAYAISLDLVKASTSNIGRVKTSDQLINTNVVYDSLVQATKQAKK